MSQYLTVEMIRAERARRVRVREQERQRTKSMLRIIPGGKQNCESVGNCEQTPAQ